VLADFSGRIAGALSVDEVLPRIAEAAAHGVGATRSRVRVFVPRSEDRAVAWPPEAVAGPFERTLPVLHQGVPVGEIAISKPERDVFTSADDRLLADLAAQAGPAIENVRLGLELQARLAELQASRQRIVTAQDAERRRLERDIHDGAQQHLVALAVTARVARDLVRTEPGEAESLLDEITTQATTALTQLRELARGVFPAVLAERGLAAAIEAHVAGYPGVRLEAGQVGENTRFAPEVEAAAYFCCLEALQNCAKHAPGAAVAVSLARPGPGWLEFAVGDDGPGFDPRAVRSGSGRQNMADRLAALGGALQLRSEPGRGTTVTGRLPARALPAPESPKRPAHV
jgi:signal transduction histidine kinase